MSLLAALLLASALPAVAGDSASPLPPRGGVTVMVRAQAEILRAEHAVPDAGDSGLQRRLSRRADGQVQVEFD
jgi:hypothetical protein